MRKGNPKGIHDWADLARPDVAGVAPNPKTGGGARWIYLAAWGYALERELGDLAKLKDPAAAADVAKAQQAAEQYVGHVYQHMPVLDSGARGSTNTFVQRGIGDVLLAWENEAMLALREMGPDSVELVRPSLSILAEPPVALVDTVVDRKDAYRWRKPTCNTCLHPKGRRSLRSTSTGRGIPRCSNGTRRSSRT